MLQTFLCETYFNFYATKLVDFPFIILLLLFNLKKKKIGKQTKKFSVFSIKRSKNLTAIFYFRLFET